MSDYRITCVNKTASVYHHHIISVGLGTTNTYSVGDIYGLIDQGHTFYTISPSTGRRADVGKFYCRNCSVHTLRSQTDGIQDNNLDELPHC